MPMTECFLQFQRKERERMSDRYCRDPELLGRILKYEEGEATDEEIYSLYQELVDTGLAWRLQGHYGRTAERFIREGHVLPPPE